MWVSNCRTGRAENAYFRQLGVRWASAQALHCDRYRLRLGDRRPCHFPAGTSSAGRRQDAVGPAAGKGKFGLIDHEKMFCPDPKTDDTFDTRGVFRETGCMVVVRPDQYVAHVLPG